MFGSNQRESRAHIRAQTTIVQPNNGSTSIYPQLISPSSEDEGRQSSFNFNAQPNNLPFAVGDSPPMSPQPNPIHQSNSYSRYVASHLQYPYQSSIQYQSPNDGLNSRIRTVNQSTTQSTPSFYSPAALNGASRRLTHTTSRPESPVDAFSSSNHQSSSQSVLPTSASTNRLQRKRKLSCPSIFGKLDKYARRWMIDAKFSQSLLRRQSSSDKRSSNQRSWPCMCASLAVICSIIVIIITFVSFWTSDRQNSQNDQIIDQILFPRPYLPDSSPFSGYQSTYQSTTESEDVAFHRLISQRKCEEFDLACAAGLTPLSPLAHRLESLQSDSQNPHHLVFLLLSDGSFVDMAMNLICSADAQSIDRSHWLIVATDLAAYRFFTLRGLNVVRLKQARLSEDAREGGDWGSTSHVSINREKIPLLHTLLSINCDVLLFDADIVFLAPLQNLFKQSINVDMEVMHDYPYGILPSLYTPEALRCLKSKDLATTTPACSYLWELNGGLILVRSSRRTVRLIEDAFDWLMKNPTNHDQDAFRFIVKQRFFSKQLLFIDDNDEPWPPSNSQANNDALTLRYLPPLLAPNGGLFFFEGRSMYLEAANSISLATPIILHINWIVGYQRKLDLITTHGLWFVEGLNGKSVCSTVASRAVHVNQSVPHMIQHRSTEYARISYTAQKSSDPASPDDVTWTVVESALQNNHLSLNYQAINQPLYKRPATGVPLVFMFSSPKPISAYLSLPAVHRAADSDGLGEMKSAVEMTEEEQTHWQQVNGIQLRAQLTCLASWFSLADQSQNFAQVALFSGDIHHKFVADSLSFDFIPHLDLDEFGAPKLHSLFRAADLIAARRDIPMCLYTNGDLAFGDDLMTTARAIESYEFAEFLAVGQRRAFNPAFIEHSPDEYLQFLDAINQKIKSINQGASVTGNHVELDRSLMSSLFAGMTAKSTNVGMLSALDYFLYSRSFWDWREVPRFLLGRVAFDNWLLHWANSRKSATVIDISETVTALHMEHNHTLSSLAPNGMTNLRLAGQASHRGLGSLEHVTWKTVRLPTTGEIRVVRVEPTQGHLKSLYDAAIDAAVELHGRHTVIVVTADTAFINILDNWLVTMRRARGDTQRGILILSVSAEVTELARRRSVPCFELASGDKAYQALNGAQTSYLQILSLRAKAIQFLLEFGFDVLHCHVDQIWLRDPFQIINQGSYSLTDTESERDIPLDEQSVNWYGAGLDLVAFTYAPHSLNTSMGGLLLRHTPECLRLWRRVTAQFAALVNRATMPGQLNLMNLYEDWYINFELTENEQLKFGLIDPRPDLDLVRFRTFPDYRRGSLHDSSIVEERMKTFGVWLLDKDRSDHFFAKDRTDRKLRGLTDYQPVKQSVFDHVLSAAERSLVDAAVSAHRSVSLVELTESNAETVVGFLERISTLSINHVVIVTDSVGLIQQHQLQSFAYLAAPSGLSSRHHLGVRIHQLLRFGIDCLIVDPDSVWFDEPLSKIAEQLQSDGRACHVLAQTTRNRSIDDGLVVLMSNDHSRALIVETVNRCELSVDLTTNQCLRSASDNLQSLGLLSVCSLDPDWFPSAYSMFESGHAIDGGTYPVVSPRSFRQSTSGRVKEFVKGFEDWAKTTTIEPPVLSAHPENNDNAPLNQSTTQSINQPADSRCPMISSSDVARPHFHLTLRVLTYTRSESLIRLLQSINQADYDGDRITLEISVDALPDKQSMNSANQSDVVEQRDRVIDISEHFSWYHGHKRVIYQSAHAGLVNQWLKSFSPASHEDTHFSLILEDDLEVSPAFYHFIKQSICKYYMRKTEFDPYLFGISLQNQRHVIGQSRKNMLKLRQANLRAINQTTNPDPFTVLGVDSVLTESHSPVWRYQLLGTWGLLIFPHHWREFLAWYGKQSTHPSFNPCVPFFESSVWWSMRPHAVWSQWFIRFTFERGWYALYYRHQPNNQLALSMNHREQGENYSAYKGPDVSGLLELKSDPSNQQPNKQSTSHSNDQYSLTIHDLPPLRSTPLIDFHGQSIKANGKALAQRQLLLTSRHWKSACKPSVWD